MSGDRRRAGVEQGSRLPILILGGPTAAGKSAAALAVAQAYGATIVSADAMAVYLGMDIGTAKPSADERAQVPHVGIDVVSPYQPFDAADFVQIADRAIHEGRVVVAGGTHFYLRSLVRGLVQTPAVDPELRGEIEAIEDLHSELSQIDPALARRLHPNDRVRLVRGIEVFRATGQRLSDLQQAHAAQPDRHAATGLWLDRDDLNERIDERVLAMMDAGYLAEVRGLLDAGYSRDLKPMKSLGYRHLADHLLDALPLDEAVRRTQRDTRQFARKQRNWLNQLGYERVMDRHVDRALAVAERLWG